MADRTIGYILPDDKMYLGDVSLYLVAYTFYEGRFKSASLFYKGEKNYNLLKTICKDRYGEEELEEGFYELVWHGQESFVVLSYDYIDETGSLGLTSTPIADEEIEARDKEEVEKAAGNW